MANCFKVSKKILDLLKISYSSSYLRDALLSHPVNNSLLSISDTLSNYQVYGTAVKVDKKKLSQILLPCVVQVSKHGREYFQVLVSLTKDSVNFFDENGKRKSSSSEDFLKNWTGVALSVEADDHEVEPDVKKWKRERVTRTGLLLLLGISLVLWAGTRLSFESFSQSDVIFSILYLALKIGGLVIGIFLLWYEVDRNNPLLQRFCTGGKRINCDAVLGSTASHFFSAELSLSTLVFSYFLAGAILLLIGSFSTSSLAFLAYVSAATLPIVIFSLYHQAKVLKNWCRFCLLVDGVLVLEMAVMALGRFYSEPFDLSLLPIFMVVFLIVLIAWIRVKPLLSLKNDLLQSKSSLTKFKSQPVIFETLLARSKKITIPPEDMGIVFKGKSAKHKVLKVCNPYCGPCSKTHSILEKLYKAGNIDLQIIFTPGGGWEDPRNKTIGHLLAIADKGDTEQIHRALDDWYGGDKDYEAFAGRYRLNGELLQQEDKIAAMRNWCEFEGIRYTPTIFVNGQELPSSYVAEDLIYILT